MSAVLGVTGPIFALIAVGYGVTRFGFFQPADLRALGRYVVVLALPALIFRAVGQGTSAAVAMLAMTVAAFFTIGAALWSLGLAEG